MTYVLKHIKSKFFFDRMNNVKINFNKNSYIFLMLLKKLNTYYFYRWSSRVMWSDLNGSHPSPFTWLHYFVHLKKSHNFPKMEWLVAHSRSPLGCRVSHSLVMQPFFFLYAIVRLDESCIFTIWCGWDDVTWHNLS